MKMATYTLKICLLKMYQATIEQADKIQPLYVD